MRRMTAEEFRKEQAAGSKRKNKYNAQKTTVDGLKFDSKKEARRWLELLLMQKRGEITGLERQVRVYLRGQKDFLRRSTGVPMSTVIDFCYIEDGQLIYEDAKGVKVRDWVLKAAVMRAMGLIVRET